MSTTDATDDEQSDESEESQDDADVGSLYAEIDAETLEVAVSALATTADANYDGTVWSFDAEEGVRALGTDPAGVLMAEVRIGPDGFETYDAGGLELGVKLDRFADMATVGDETTLAWDTDTWKLNVESGPVDAELSVLDPDGIDTTVPDANVWQEADAEIAAERDSLKTALDTTAKLSSSKVVEFHVSDDLIGVRKAGDDDKVSTAIDAAVEHRDGDVMSLMQELNLRDVAKSIPKAVDDVTITASDEWPLTVRYSHAGADVTFIQAPRIPK